MDKVEFRETLTAMLEQRKIDKAKEQERIVYDYIGCNMSRKKQIARYYRSH